MKSFRVLGLSCLLLLTSCAEIQHFLGLDVDYFADYRSKNLLDNTGLDAKLPDGSSKWTTTSLGLNTAGVDDYMVWERVGDAANADAGNDTAAGTPAAGPDGTSPVYRVEIKNLLPNGDFETGTSLGSYWAAVKEQVPAGAGGAIQLSLATSHPDNKQPIASPVTIPVGARTISNQSLLFAAEDNQDYLYLDLKAAIGSLWLPGQYRVRFDFINTSNSTNFHIALIDSSSGGTLGPADAESSGGWLQNGLPVVSNAERRSASRFFTIQNTTDQRK